MSKDRNIEAANKLATGQGPARRTVLKGIAWSTPVITTAFAVPVYAATAPDPELCDTSVESTIVPAPPSTNNYTQNYQAATQDVVVPAGITQIQYEVAGGGGGVSTNIVTDREPGGAGDLITGTLQVVPGTILTLVTGNGGIGMFEWMTGNSNNAPKNTLIKGGGGFGAGGDVFISDSLARYAGGTGGGGSAILVGDVPVVVAGGGGGAGGGFTTHTNTWHLNVADSAGGNGGLAAASGGQFSITVSGTGSNNGGTHTAAGGAGANGANPGTRANAGFVGTWETPISGTNVNGGVTYGNDGNGYVAGVGGKGADGAMSLTGTFEGNEWDHVSGAGGGGYAGGASGDTVSINRATSSPVRGATTGGGGGGGGSSYIASDSVGGVTVLSHTHSSAANGVPTAVRTRRPGWIKLTFKC